MYFALLT